MDFLTKHGFRLIAKEEHFTPEGIVSGTILKYASDDNIMVITAKRITGDTMVSIRIGNTPLMGFTSILADEINFATLIDEIRAEIAIRTAGGSLSSIKAGGEA